MYDPDRCEVEKATEEDEELEIIEEAWRKPSNVKIEPEWQKNLNEAGEDVQIVESDYIGSRSPSPTDEPHFDFDLLKRMVEYKWPSLQDQYHSPDIENEVYTTKHLGYGIRMVMPLHLYEGESYIAEPLDPDRRTKEFEFIKLAEDETCCTDIYILMKKSLDGKKSPIRFHSDYSDDIKFLMSIKEKPRGPTEFIAHILANGQWSLVKTSYEENEIKFSAATVELLFVITRPKTQHFELTPDGFLFQDENDSTLQVDFPEGSVDQNYSIGIKILHPDTESMKLRHQMFPNLHNIVAITQKIQVNHKVEKFLSPIEIRSALEKFLPDMSHEYHMVRIWWHGNDVTITDANNVECKDDVVTAGVKEFSGNAIALVKNRDEAFRYGAIDAQLCFGEKYRCTIIVFARKEKEDCISIWCELVQIEFAEIIADKRIKEESVFEIRSSRAGDLELRHSQRLRIDIGGNSKRIQGTTDYCFITFIPKAHKNHIFFPLQRNNIMGQNPYTIIKFSADKGPKHLVHMVHFDPWSGKSNIRALDTNFAKQENIYVYKDQQIEIGQRSTTHSRTPRYTRSLTTLDSPRSDGLVRTSTFPGSIETMYPREITTTISAQNVKAQPARDTTMSPRTEKISKPIGVNTMKPPSTQSAAALQTEKTVTLPNTENIANPKRENTMGIRKSGWFDDDRNVMAISNILPSTEYLQIGISLGLNLNDVDRIHQQYHTNLQTVMFRILKHWLNTHSETNGGEHGKLEDLVDVLDDLNLSVACNKIQEFFKEGKILRNRDLRNADMT